MWAMGFTKQVILAESPISSKMPSKIKKRIIFGTQPIFEHKPKHASPIFEHKPKHASNECSKSTVVYKNTGAYVSIMKSVSKSANTG